MTVDCILTVNCSYHFGFGFTVLTFYLNPYWLKVLLLLLLLLVLLVNLMDDHALLPLIILPLIIHHQCKLRAPILHIKFLLNGKQLSNLHVLSFFFTVLLTCLFPLSESKIDVVVEGKTPQPGDISQKKEKGS